MSLVQQARQQVRRVTAAWRTPVRSTPIDRLAELLARGAVDGPDHLVLCHDIGLVHRAAEAMRRAAPGSVSIATRIRHAILCGRLDDAIALSRELARHYPSGGLPRAELQLAVGCLAPVSADAALELIRASAQALAARPALLLRLGERDEAARSLLDLAPVLGPQHGLLCANLQSSPADKLAGLNRCLVATGLSPVALIDAARPPSVHNIGVPAPSSRRRGGPLLSVVMTCYDSASHLDGALRSVFDQEYAHLELIAVDDGSRDDTWQHLRATARTEPRLRAVRLHRNVGTYAAKNVGLGLARGAFIAFQDADDWSHPQRFSRCVDVLLNEPSLVAATALYVRLQDDGVFWSSKVWPLLRWSSNSVVFRRAAVEDRVGDLDEHRFGADSEFVARIKQAFGAHAVRRFELPLILAARRDSSLMHSRATGLDVQGRSQARIDYQEAWTEQLLEHVRSATSLRRQARIGTPELIAESAGGTGPDAGPA
jgi:Glycosyl transferase family 2